MPLQGGSSREAFEHNVRAEIEAGKPQKQALAIAYREKGGDAEITRSQIQSLISLPQVDDVEAEGLDEGRFFVHLKSGWSWPAPYSGQKTKSFGSYGEASRMAKQAVRDEFCSVYEEDGKWFINRSGSVRGPFQTRSEAMQARMSGDSVGQVFRDCMYAVGQEKAPRPYSKYSGGDSIGSAFRDNLAEHLINAAEHVRGQTGDDQKPAREMSVEEIKAELAKYKSNGFGAPKGRFEALKIALSEKE